MKVIHITPHLGGGIGSAYVGLGACGIDQEIITLEEQIKVDIISDVEASGFKVHISPGMDVTRRKVETADIVLINWMHHPAVTKFLIDISDIPIRSVLWAHVSGNYFPAIMPEFLQLFTQCVFASPYALTTKGLAGIDDEYKKRRFGIVYGLGDLKRFSEVTPKRHARFTIGYVGTLNFCKLHPQFVDYCAAVDVPLVEFVMYGDIEYRDSIISMAKSRGIADKFHFPGYTKDIPEALSKMDVFGYILNPQHYGATENALLEALAAGVPVVALNQCVESIIIKDSVNGSLVSSPLEYARVIRNLYCDQTIARKQTEYARNNTPSKYSIVENRKRMLSHYESAMAYEKTISKFNEYFGPSPADWFLSAVNDDRLCFTENRANEAGLIFNEKTKASPRHYYSYFPDDPQLKAWVNQLDKVIE